MSKEFKRRKICTKKEDWDFQTSIVSLLSRKSLNKYLLPLVNEKSECNIEQYENVDPELILYDFCAAGDEEKRETCLRNCLEEVSRLSKLKSLFPPSAPERKIRDRNKLIEILVTKFMKIGSPENSEVGKTLESRDIEKENIEMMEKGIRVYESIFLELCGITLPFDVVSRFLSFLEFNYKTITEIGCVSKDFYLAILCCWDKVKISARNLFRISLLVLRNVKKIELWGNLSKNDVNYVVDKMKKNNFLREISFVDPLCYGTESENDIEEFEGLRLINRVFSEIKSVQEVDCSSFIGIRKVAFKFFNKYSNRNMNKYSNLSVEIFPNLKSLALPLSMKLIERSIERVKVLELQLPKFYDLNQSSFDKRKFRCVEDLTLNLGRKMDYGDDRYLISKSLDILNNFENIEKLCISSLSIGLLPKVYLRKLSTFILKSENDRNVNDLSFENKENLTNFLTRHEKSLKDIDIRMGFDETYVDKVNVFVNNVWSYILSILRFKERVKLCIERNGSEYSWRNNDRIIGIFTMEYDRSRKSIDFTCDLRKREYYYWQERPNQSHKDTEKKFKIFIRILKKIVEMNEIEEVVSSIVVTLNKYHFWSASKRKKEIKGLVGKSFDTEKIITDEESVKLVLRQKGRK